jgi:Protein of unknown function (DUF3515)
MPDDSTRRAAWISAFVAVPLALVAGIVVFFALHDRVTGDAAAGATPSASASTGPVTMAAPALTAAHATMCLAFIAQLPPKQLKLAERKVTAGPEQNAAFGDPAITAACGASEPKVSPTDEIYPISGVCWYEQQSKTATVWTTLDREVPVAITIPNSYNNPPAGQWVAEFSDAVIYTLPSIKTPYNC